MRFKVVPFEGGSQRDDAVLQGIANGFGELYPVPNHPHCVQRLLDEPKGDENGQRDRSDWPRVARPKVRAGQRG